MIVTQVVVFGVMLLAGALAGSFAFLFYFLGGGSRAARAIFDFLTPPTIGVIYFFALRWTASGVFRLFSLSAFVMGFVLQCLFLRRFSPSLRRFACKIILPIKSLEESLECRVKARFEPFARKIGCVLEKRRADRGRKRAERETLKKRRAAEKETKRAAARALLRKDRGSLARARVQNEPTAKVIDNARVSRYNMRKNPKRGTDCGSEVSYAGAAVAGFRSRKRTARHIHRV